MQRLTAAPEPATIEGQASPGGGGGWERDSLRLLLHS
jgi:hypothetical protein